MTHYSSGQTPLAGGIRIKTLPILTNGHFDGPLWHLPTRSPITLQAPIVEKNPPTINKACQYASKCIELTSKAKTSLFWQKISGHYKAITQTWAWVTCTRCTPSRAKVVGGPAGTDTNDRIA
ncbi:hypothetical protein CDAR_608141 [Caerostris darwini]|uniref:Uncharacterized protein n=1 Tax=Caerostris darwini TaxID=1538125 RepID=A0AAV4Q5U5_9ARAC|nr:hypothetical protein CDAR_608141 [Caerostris darwini]